jgi:hypothetical protein
VDCASEDRRFDPSRSPDDLQEKRSPRLDGRGRLTLTRYPMASPKPPTASPPMPSSCRQGSRRRARLGFPLQGFVVPEMDATVYNLHGSLFPQIRHGPGYCLPVGPDHGP